jgi:hypothetical protein
MRVMVFRLVLVAAGVDVVAASAASSGASGSARVRAARAAGTGAARARAAAAAATCDRVSDHPAAALAANSCSTRAAAAARSRERCSRVCVFGGIARSTASAALTGSSGLTCIARAARRRLTGVFVIAIGIARSEIAANAQSEP